LDLDEISKVSLYDALGWERVGILTPDHKTWTIPSIHQSHK